MTIIIFLIILSALVLVHEAGHFFVAKYFGIRVDEFGLGYPPKAKKLFSWRGTDFTLNWLPFGGFVKIFGENPGESEIHQGESLVSNPKGLSSRDSFQNKNRGIQSAVLVSGVIGNFIFAWFLISLGFMIGMPTPEGLSLPVTNSHTVITEVVPDSPAQLAGLKSGDIIVAFSGLSSVSPENIMQFIDESTKPIEVTVSRGSDTITKTISPTDGIVEGKKAIGIGMDNVGIAKLSFGRSIIEGFNFTVQLTKATAVALGGFILSAFVGEADLSQVTGPVGLVGIVGDVSALGFVYLISLTALISINLAIINLLPFPALDGGRLLFVIIEAIRRKAIPAKVFNVMNNVGFGILIILMLLVTFRDIVHLI